jgi:hypothetical protein
LFTILHGRAAGILGGATAGYLAGKAAGVAIPGVALDVLGAGAGATGSLMNAPRKMLAQVVYGATQEQALAALQRAATDPAYAILLSQKPTMENVLKLRGLLRTSKYAPMSTFAGYRSTVPEVPEEPTTEEQYRLLEQGRPLTIRGRPQRASGGAVNLKALANAAKRAVCKSTEDLLQTPDAHVVQALKVATRHI